MNKDLLIFALISCNKNYRQITQERKPVVEQHKLKNVTPNKPTLIEAFKAGVKAGEKKAMEDSNGS